MPDRRNTAFSETGDRNNERRPRNYAGFVRYLDRGGTWGRLRRCVSVPFPVPPFRLHYKRMGKCMAACIGDAHGRDVPDNPMAEGVRYMLGAGFRNNAAVFSR